MRGGGRGGGVGWEVSGISSWATVGRGATGGCCYCWRRESGEGESKVCGLNVPRHSLCTIFTSCIYVSSQLTEYCTENIFVQNTKTLYHPLTPFCTSAHWTQDAHTFLTRNDSTTQRSIYY